MVIVVSIYLRFYIEAGVGVGTFLPTPTPTPTPRLRLLLHSPGKAPLARNLK
jgi:hypothetical protein